MRKLLLPLYAVSVVLILVFIGPGSSSSTSPTTSFQRVKSSAGFELHGKVESTHADGSVKSCAITCARNTKCQAVTVENNMCTNTEFTFFIPNPGGTLPDQLYLRSGGAKKVLVSSMNLDATAGSTFVSRAAALRSDDPADLNTLYSRLDDMEKFRNARDGKFHFFLHYGDLDDAKGFEWKQSENPMDVTDPTKTPAGFETVNEDEWYLRQSQLDTHGFRGLRSALTDQALLEGGAGATSFHFMAVAAETLVFANGLLGPRLPDGTIEYSKDVRLYAFVDELV